MKKTALITGGAIRIGRTLAETCAHRGYQLVIHYNRSAKEALSFSKQLAQENVDHHLIQSDLSDQNNLAQFFDQIPSAFKPVDLLINSAAIFPKHDSWDNLGVNWDGVLTVNSLAPLMLAQQFSKQATGSKNDYQIVNIIDARLNRANSDLHLVYRWSKALLKQATKDLSIALAPQIRVNAIAPGAILPPPGETQQHLDRLAEKIPLKKTGDIQQMSYALDYLLNQTFVTGEVLTVDGGEFL